VQRSTIFVFGAAEGRAGPSFASWAAVLGHLCLADDTPISSDNGLDGSLDRPKTLFGALKPFLHAVHELFLLEIDFAFLER
jgi:hypothetical protein